MNIYLTTLGCRLNEAEIASWSREFRAGGHRVVPDPASAQLVVVNTCAVTREAARKSRKFIGNLHRQNPSANLVLTGCFAQLEPGRAASLAGVDLVIGNRDKDRLVALVSERFAAPTMPALATEPGSSHAFADAAPGPRLAVVGPGAGDDPGRTRAFVKVQDGCRNRCTFCIVTIARGEERSRRVADVVDEIAGLAARGYREAVLTGVHLGGYGSDLGTDLRCLVQAVLDRTDIPRLRLSSLEPWDLPAGFWDLWRDERLMPHLHLPLQSGSDAVLRRMSRRTSTASYADLVAAARAAIPALTLTTDVIVGFPGESEAEWAETVDYVQRIGFGHMHIFAYSPRQGTKAAGLRGQVPGPVKRARSRELHRVAAAMKRAHLDRFVGDTRAVLWEGPGAAGPDGARSFTGYTDNYLRVETAVPAGVDLDNRVTPARLLAVAGQPDDLMAARLIAEVPAGIGADRAHLPSAPISTPC